MASILYMHLAIGNEKDYGIIQNAYALYLVLVHLITWS